MRPVGTGLGASGGKLAVFAPCGSLYAASSLASIIRCTQKEHFSMTPFCLTVTSGLSCPFERFRAVSKVNQLNRLTL